LIAERVRAGIRNARAKGKRIGRPKVIVDGQLGFLPVPVEPYRSEPTGKR
jgi:DNA invertase Pin-like site-specific DNA recombinase